MLGIILLAGCSKESACDCWKTTYETEIVEVIVNGEREERWTRNILEYKQINCSDEVEAQYVGNDTYIDVECY